MPETNSRAPLSERACEACVWAFALFTLCSHGVVGAGGSLFGLLALYLGAALAALFAWWRLRQREPPQAPRPLEDWGSPPTWLRPVSASVAAGAAVLAVAWGDPIVTWVLLLAVLVPAAAVHLLLEAPPTGPPALRSQRAEIGLLVLAVACAVYALVAHRSDADDAFYVNLAVAAIHLPEVPLLARDTLHGRFDLPVFHPVYRLHSYELWNAAVALLTGLSPLYAFHWISAALGAFLVPLCHAVLFRQLTPRIWPFTTLALVVVLAAAGETHRWYGNFAFVRMWQGKAFLLFVFLPLVYAYALRFAQRGDALSWLRLAAVQVAALGCSSTALWSAPIAAWMALACTLRPARTDLRRLLVGALASSYVLAAGVWMRSQMKASLPDLAGSYEPGVQLAEALVTAFGDARLHAVGVGTIFLAWACCPPGLARRFAIALPLAVSAILLNPWADSLVRSNVVGPWYWRVMWALPAPILMALVAVAPLRAAARSPVLARLGVALLLAAFVFWVPSFPGYGERNRVRLDWPGAKVGDEYRWALAMNELAPRQRVVAPPGVAAWVPVHADHAYPLAVLHYLRMMRDRVGEIAYRDRTVMTQLANGSSDHPRAPAIFERGLELYDVQAVCLRTTGGRTASVRQILRRAGFVKRLQSTDLEIWSRAGPEDGPTRS